MTGRLMTQIGLAASRWYSARQRRLVAGRAKRSAETLSEVHEKQHGWARNPFWQPARTAAEVFEAAKLRERKALRALSKLCAAQSVAADADDVEDLATLPRLALSHTTS